MRVESAIAENVKRIRERMDEACVKAGRSAGSVTLVAATKTVNAASIREAVQAGIDAAGENRVQELVDKHGQKAYDGVSLHFIGHLQKNKIKHVVGVAELIESADSSELIRLIGARAEHLGIVQDILLEVNIGGESSKSGVHPALVPELIDFISKTGGVRLRGIMAIPPFSSDSAQNRHYFSLMYKLFVDIGSKKYDNISVDLLSMGMSGDYYDAILEGSNMIRVGTAIFGDRER